jgi:hypothetical protein
MSPDSRGSAPRWSDEERAAPFGKRSGSGASLQGIIDDGSGADIGELVSGWGERAPRALAASLTPLP